MKNHLYTKLYLSKEFIFIISFLTIYLVSRLINLTELPVFLDEGVHIWWAQDFLKGNLFRSLKVGRFLEPLFIAPGLLVGISPLFWARFVHIIAGMFSLIFIYLVGRDIYNQQVGGIASFVYLVIPYAVFHDRIALTEIYVSLSSLLIIWATLQTSKSVTPMKFALLTSLFLILGFVAKMPTGMFLATIPLLLAVFLNKKTTSNLLEIRILSAFYIPFIIFMVGCGIVALWRISQGDTLGFGLGLVSKQTGEVSLIRLLEQSWQNTQLTIIWLGHYFTWPLMAIIFSSFARVFWYKDKVGMALASFSFISCLPFIFGADHWFPRYLFFLTPSLCLLLGSTLWEIWKGLEARLAFVSKGMLFLLCALLFFPALYQSGLILWAPKQAELPDIDRYQYITGHAAGYGYQEVADWLHSNNALQVVPLTVGDYVQLDVYASETLRPNIQKFKPIDEQMRDQIVLLVERYETIYLVETRRESDILDELADFSLNVSVSYTASRPYEETSLTVYEVSR